MDNIHEDDIGHNTRVFEITSVKLNVTTQICVGKAHEDNGKTVYNVYEVNGDHVTRRIGYYEQGENDFDDAGDFNVAKREEPEWSVEGKTFSEIPESKKAASKTEKVKKSLFTIKPNKANGDCFFESVLEGEGKKPTAEAIQKLRDDIGNFIDISPVSAAAIVDYYNASKPRKIKEVYPDLVQKLKDAGDDESKLEELKQEVLKKIVDEHIPEALFSYEILLTVKENEDALLPQPVSGDKDVEEEESHFMRDYFGNDFSLTTQDEIIDAYTQHLSTPGVYADQLVLTMYQSMRSIMLLVLIGDGKIEKTVASFQDVVKTVKKIIVLRYSGQNHYELVCYNKQCSFDWKGLPEIIKNKFADTPWYDELNEKEEPDSDSSEDELHADAEPVPTVPKAVPPVAPVAPVPKAVPPVPSSSPLEDATEIPKPAPKAKASKTKKASFTSEFTREQLNALKIPELKDIIAENPSSYKNYLKNGTKEHFIDCILDPELEKCYTKAGWVLRKQTGGKFTRKA
jgi:hypothetical protein